MLNVVAERPQKLRFEVLVFSAEEQGGCLTLSQDTDVILISLGSNSPDFLSPSSSPQLNIAFPLKRPSSNRSHLSLLPAAEASASDAFQGCVSSIFQTALVDLRCFALHA